MRLAVYSTLTGTRWGASESLWSEAAGRLLAGGHRISACCEWHPGPLPPRLAALRRQGAALTRRRRPGERLVEIAERVGVGGERDRRRSRGIERWLERARPDRVLVSCGSHLDDAVPAEVCLRLGLPYALLVHAVPPGRRVPDSSLGRWRQVYGGARRVLFVSDENRRIVESQLAVDLPRVGVVASPLAVAPEESPPWPAEGDGTLLLACVARLGCWQKSQDLLIEVLARDRWRGRPVRLDLWGAEDGNGRQLRDLVRLHGLEDRVRFRGVTRSPGEIWRWTHALVLPSRYEGVPLVVPEAMLCGRVPVVTAVGRNPEWVEEGATGFLAAAATPDLVGGALERAWAARTRWRDIGRAAAERVRRLYPERPVEQLVDDLLALEQSAREGGAEGEGAPRAP